MTRVTRENRKWIEKTLACAELKGNVAVLYIYSLKQKKWQEGQNHGTWYQLKELPKSD